MHTGKYDHHVPCSDISAQLCWHPKRFLLSHDCLCGKRDMCVTHNTAAEVHSTAIAAVAVASAAGDDAVGTSQVDIVQIYRWERIAWRQANLA